MMLFACSDAVPADRNVETEVDPSTPAGDYRGVTGEVRKLSVETDLVAPRDVEVWLPPSYADDPDRRYPVLYMHDGQNVFDPEQSAYSGWDWGVDEALTALGIEVIVVAPHSIDRTRNLDYFPQKAGKADADRYRRDFGSFDTRTLNADNYLRYLVEEVKPRIDADFRTLPGQDNTFVMGSSMGGLISLYAISEYPHVFGGAGMVSTHFPLADGALVDWFSGQLPDPKTHRLYFDYGTNTLDWNYEGFQDRMDAAVERAGYVRGENWTTRKFEGHDHSERAWRNRVHIPLQFLLTRDNVPGGEQK